MCHAASPIHTHRHHSTLTQHRHVSHFSTEHLLRITHRLIHTNVRFIHTKSNTGLNTDSRYTMALLTISWPIPRKDHHTNTHTAGPTPAPGPRSGGVTTSTSASSPTAIRSPRSSPAAASVLNSSTCNQTHTSSIKPETLNLDIQQSLSVFYLFHIYIYIYIHMCKYNMHQRHTPLKFSWRLTLFWSNYNYVCNLTTHGCSE